MAADQLGDDDERALGNDAGAFARWLLGRETPEVVLRLDPVEVSSWDYRARMAPATAAPGTAAPGTAAPAGTS